MSTANDPISVLCFGDSLTWGFNPVDRTRYGHDVRWTRLLQQRLGPDYYVIEEGLNGRTTVFEDPVMGDKNGLDHLATLRKTHMPIDILVLMLGTNDLKSRFNLTAEEIAQAMGRLLDYLANATPDPEGKAPKVLLMSPPPLGDFADSPLGAFFNMKSREQSKRLASCYLELAELQGTAFFDTGSVISVSQIDSIHFDGPPQAKLAEAIAEEVLKLSAELPKAG